MKRILILLIAATAVSCGAQKVSYRESSARIVEPSLGALVTPLIADMQLISEEKITPYVEVFPFEVTGYSIRHVDLFKRTALLNAAKKYGADVIVGAILDVETTPRGEFQITVTGYPARWINFRNATREDMWMVDMYRTLPHTDNTQVLRPTEKQEIRTEDQKRKIGSR